MFYFLFKGYPSSSDINQEVSLVYQSSTCDYRRTSSLKYNITIQDTQIEFMCEDNTNSLCGSGLFTKQVTLKNCKYCTVIYNFWYRGEITLIIPY